MFVDNLKSDDTHCGELADNTFTILCCPHRVDCVGILKLRNADVEARIGVAGSKKKSTRARLAFRVNIPLPDGSVLTLQVPSSPILCSKYNRHIIV